MQKKYQNRRKKTEKKLADEHTYSLGGYDWLVAETKGNCAVLQSCGVTSGEWPGYVMPECGGGDWYDQNIDGKNISSYDATMSKLYACIKDAEYVSADYGKGLYLISSKKYEESENYRYAIRRACDDYARFGAACIRAWLGTVYDSHNACFAVAKHVFQDPQYNRYVIAPAFNVDVSKIALFGDEICLAERK